MKVVHLNTYDWGGAGTATKRLHRGLRDIGVDSRMLVADKRGDDPHVYGPDSMLRRAYALGRIVLDSLPLNIFGGSDVGFSVQWLPDDLAGRIEDQDPDLLHLNWVGEGFLNVKTLKKIDTPIVWRLPDMWALTGGCHYASGCDGFTESCGSCPHLDSDMRHDISWWTLRRKRKAWKDLDITLVAPTTWLADQVKRSSLFSENRVEVIPNGLETDLYRPYDTGFARNVFDLPTDSKLILFGAVSPTSDDRKGFEYLRKALNTLSEGEFDDDVEIVVFGGSEPEDPPDLGFDTRYVGYLNDDESLALLYAAADVMVVPSKYEGFGQTVTEAQACGTPVVAFDATGPRDTVEHEETGYLADPYDSDDLAQGIKWVLRDPTRTETVGDRARQRAVEQYDIDVVATQYRDLYRELLEQ